MTRHLARCFGALILLFSTLVASSTVATAQSGRDFYVGPGGDDDNVGTSIDAPVATLQHGAGLLSAGDTLWVLPGTYDGFSASITGAPGAYARIAALPGTSPVIDAGEGNGAHFHNSSYVEMWGLELKGDSGITNSPYGIGILMTGETHHMRLVQNEIHHFGAGGLITYQAGDHLEIYHNTIHNNANWNPDQHSGISLLGLVDDGTDSGADYNNYVVGNLVYTNEVKVRTDQFGGGTRVTDGNCFVVDVTVESEYTGNTLFASNICVNNGGRGTQVYKSADVDVVNNTFYHNMRTPDVARIGSEVMAYDSTRVRFANNLIMSRPGVLPLTAGVTDPVTFANNLTVGTKNPAKSPSDRHLANGTRVLEKVSTNPADLTAANFTPVANSAAIDHGSATYANVVAVDFAGNERSSGKGPDAGALERGAGVAENWPWAGDLAGPGSAPSPAPTPAPTPEPEQPEADIPEADTDEEPNPEPAPAPAPDSVPNPDPEPAPDRQSVDELRATMARLYSAAFLRPADDSGLDYWLGVDADLIDIAHAFTVSAEFSNRYGNLDDDGFVDRMYRNVLDRPADEGGYRYWTGLMDNGLTRAELLLHFSDSAEFRTQ